MHPDECGHNEIGLNAGEDQDGTFLMLFGDVKEELTRVQPEMHQSYES